MIIIDIKNAQTLARKEKGRLKVFFATLFGVDIARKVDEAVAERLATEFRLRGVEVEVRIEKSPSGTAPGDGSPPRPAAAGTRHAAA